MVNACALWARANWRHEPRTRAGFALLGRAVNLPARPTSGIRKRGPWEPAEEEADDKKWIVGSTQQRGGASIKSGERVLILEHASRASAPTRESHPRGAAATVRPRKNKLKNVSFPSTSGLQPKARKSRARASGFLCERARACPRKSRKEAEPTAAAAAAGGRRGGRGGGAGHAPPPRPAPRPQARPAARPRARAPLSPLVFSSAAGRAHVHTHTRGPSRAQTSPAQPPSSSIAHGRSDAAPSLLRRSTGRA